MKTVFALLIASTLWVSAAEPSRPNVILIISDDQGFMDYGFMGNPQVRTPHIDRMAAESLLYTRGYVMPVCSPSLASLLTGQLPHAHGITGNDLLGAKTRRGQRDALAARLLGNSLLLPKALADAGYLTFQTGKLWNTTYRDVGFTHGMTDTAGRHGDAGLDIGRKGMKPIYDFIALAQAEQKPFFIWHAPLLPHDPHTPPEDIYAKYQGKGPTPAAEKYHAMVEWFDRTTGELEAHLEEKGLKENTVILYLADNGWDAARGYQGNRAKLSPFETGIRTPIFVRWPGRIQPRRDDATLASIIDIAPTILQLTGVKGPGNLPGLVLTDRAAMTARTTVHIETYMHDIVDLNDPRKSLTNQVVIDGWWKLIVPGPATPDRPFAGRPDTIALFDLKADPLEQTDVAGSHPEVVARLSALLAPALR